MSVDIPGVLPEDVEVSIEQQILAIHARRHITDERSVRFMRKFRLSSALDPEAITCTLEHGVLHLTLPKAKSAQPRKVDVIVPTVSGLTGVHRSVELRQCVTGSRRRANSL